jgi:hypothetical protein
MLTIDEHLNILKKDIEDVLLKIDLYIISNHKSLKNSLINLENDKNRYLSFLAIEKDKYKSQLFYYPNFHHPDIVKYKGNLLNLVINIGDILNKGGIFDESGSEGDYKRNTEKLENIKYRVSIFKDDYNRGLIYNDTDYLTDIRNDINKFASELT